MHARIGWQNLRTSEFLDSGDYMLITGTDFIDGAVNFDTCHYVERERYEQDKHIQIRNGSILITKDGTLGKVAYIQGLTMPATLNAGVFNVEIKDENEVDNRYLFQYLKAPFLMDYVDKKATGGTIKHLNQNILVDFPVVLPHKAEQEKIGEYFLAIDHLITLHQRKYDKLTNVKKSMLEKMFPQNGSNAPEIRFKGFTEAWEQRKLGEISDKVTKKNQDVVVDEVFTNSAEYGIISQRDFFDKDIANTENIDGYYVVEPNDFVYNPRISTTAPFGPIKRNKLERSGAMSPLYYVFRPNNVDLSYLEWFFQTSCWYPFMRFNGNSGARSDRFAITDKIFNEMPISLPQDIEEQKRIGMFLTTLDTLITLHQRKPVVVNSSSTMNALPNQHLYFQVLE